MVRLNTSWYMPLVNKVLTKEHKGIRRAWDVFGAVSPMAPATWTGVGMMHQRRRNR